MFFMNNFAIADLTMLLFRSLSVDLRINNSNVIDWKYGEYLCYFENTIEVLVSGKWLALQYYMSVNLYSSGICLDDNNDGTRSLWGNNFA